MCIRVYACKWCITDKGKTLGVIVLGIDRRTLLCSVCAKIFSPTRAWTILRGDV